jgi:hypothetical protein
MPKFQNSSDPCFTKGIEVEATRSGTTITFKDPTTSRTRVRQARYWVEVKAPNFKVGDRVSYQPTSSMSTNSKRGALGTVCNLNWGVQVDWDAGNGMGSRSTEAPEHLALANPAPAAQARKTWIISLLESGKLLPSPTPVEYSSEKQAHAVAKSMAEKHRGKTFVVFEATGFVHLPVTFSTEVVRL